MMTPLDDTPEDLDCLFEAIEGFHGWYWHRYLLGQACLSSAMMIMEQHPECETVGDMPDLECTECVGYLDMAMDQYEILRTEGDPPWEQLPHSWRHWPAE